MPRPRIDWPILKRTHSWWSTSVEVASSLWEWERLDNWDTCKVTGAQRLKGKLAPMERRSLTAALSVAGGGVADAAGA